MKISTIAISLVLVAVLGGGVYFFSQSFDNAQDKRSGQDAMTKEDSGDAMMEKEESRYMPYTPEVFEMAADKKRVLYFFANWCPTGIPADKNFKENVDKIPEDVTLIRVNYTDTDTDADEKTLANKYGISYQHTFVQIDKNGEVVKKWNGGQIEELLSNIK